MEVCDSVEVLDGPNPSLGTFIVPRLDISSLFYEVTSDVTNIDNIDWAEKTNTIHQAMPIEGDLDCAAMLCNRFRQRCI
jgi:hypothetical protein